MLRTFTRFRYWMTLDSCDEWLSQSSFTILASSENIADREAEDRVNRLMASLEDVGLGLNSLVLRRGGAAEPAVEED